MNLFSRERSARSCRASLICVISRGTEVNITVMPLSAGFDTQSSGNVRFACSRIAVQDEVSSLPDEVERPQQWQSGACVIGEFVDNEVAQIFELRKVGTLYQSAAAVVGTHFKLVLHHNGHEVLHAP